MRIRSICGAIALAGATHAQAVPLVYDLDSDASSLTGTIAATFRVKVNVKLFGVKESVSGQGNLAGPLSSNPDGTILFDWGAPAWADHFDMPAGGMSVTAQDPGTASGQIKFDLFNLYTLPIDIDLKFDEIRFGLETAFSSPSLPDLPGSIAGPGPWAGADPAVEMSVGSTYRITVSDTKGLFSSTSGPMVKNSEQGDLPGAPMLAFLERDNSPPFPGTGTVLTLPAPDLPLDLSFRSVSFRIPVGECLVSGPFGSCSLLLQNVEIDPKTISLSMQPWFVADNSQIIGAPIPEPATALMLSAGWAWLTLIARRRSHRGPVA